MLKKIKELYWLEKNLLIFTIRYNFLLIIFSIPLLLIYYEISIAFLEWVSHKGFFKNYMSKDFTTTHLKGSIELIRFIFFMSYTFISIKLFTIFLFVHGRILHIYDMKKFGIHRTGKTTDDIGFLITMLLISTVYSMIVLIYLDSNFICKILTIYIIQNFVTYCLIKTNCYGYKITKPGVTT